MTRLVLTLALSIGCSTTHAPSEDASLEDASLEDASVLDATGDDGGVAGDASRDGGDGGGSDAGCTTGCACADAVPVGSHLGCEHWVVDLDNAALGAGRDASAQPFAIIVANPGETTADVVVERNRAGVGAPADLVMVASRTIAPGAAETIELGRFEVDGSTPTGVNDGTGTARTSNALRVTATAPVAVHQLNPRQTSSAFSNDASLVLPTHALGTRYHVVAWPQTIADGDASAPSRDFDPSVDDEDLRAFLTIVGTAPSTEVTVTLGPRVVQVLGDGAAIPSLGPGGELTVSLDRFDVLNLETDGFMADFTGSLVEASAPVAVFVGSEASDVPTFTDYAGRLCCADHLEAQLPSDDHTGQRFVVASSPSRTAMLGGATPAPGGADWVRIVALEPGTTTLTTSLPAPDDVIVLAEGSFVQLAVEDDFFVEATQRVSVLEALPGQEAAGIPTTMPGGDPSLFNVVPVERWSSDVLFVVPDGYAFDAITIVAPTGASIELDGAPLPSACSTSVVAGAWDVHRCQLSFATVSGPPSYFVTLGPQGDGAHRVHGSEPFFAVVSGFDSYVSYAYEAGRGGS